MRFSLFYFSAEAGAAGGAAYRLLVEGARFADRHGLTAVWTPERHFGRFGGLYPNPSVLAAGLATITRRVGLRAGSVVAPLHDPIRIAEDWAVVDNLSGGRVGISFAPGWAPDDFVLAPQAYEARRDVVRQHVDVVRRLWRGETVRARNGLGVEVDVATLPRPVRRELPFWLTTGGAGSQTRTPALAGQLGGNLLTHMVSQSPDDLATRIAAYRRARVEAGHDPAGGCVTLMLHTFVRDDMERHRERVSGYLDDYVNESVNLRLGQGSREVAAATPLSERQRRMLLKLATSRLIDEASLIGEPAACAERVGRLEALGVDEIACLIDFGPSFDEAMESLERLVDLQAAVNGRPGDCPAAAPPVG